MAASSSCASTLLLSHECPSQQCEMTWSRPHFELVAGDALPLYQFFDRGSRDGAHVDHATQHILLFIPGHAGDYRQGRSLGAEVLRESMRRQASAHVYTLSSDEARSAFDGDLLSEQAARIASALRFLGQRYARAQHGRPPAAGVTIAAHSMGGIATLEALRTLMAGKEPLPIRVDAVLLLSVPVSRPVLACSTSLARLYRRVHDFWQSHAHDAAVPAVASIFGGCRDGQVPAALSHLHGGVLPERAVALSLPSQALPGVRTPTDHLSILWCRQLMRSLARAVLDVGVAPNASAFAPALAAAAVPHTALAERVDRLRAALLDEASGRGQRTDAFTSGHDGDALLPLYALPLRALLDVTCAMLALPLVATWLRRPRDPQTHALPLLSAHLALLRGFVLGLIACGGVDAVAHVLADHGSGLVWPWDRSLSLGRASRMLMDDPTACSMPLWTLVGARLGMVAAVALALHAVARLTHPFAAARRAARLRILAAAALLALLAHPALGLLVAAIGELRGAARRLALCGVLALALNLAAWQPRRGPAIWRSADARFALAHVLLLLVARSFDAAPIAAAPDASPTMRTTADVSTRLGLAAGVILFACSSSGGDELAAHEGASVEAVVRAVALGAAVLSWPDGRWPLSTG